MAVESNAGSLICRSGEVGGLEQLLRRHPRVVLGQGPAPGALGFEQDGRTREIVVGARGEPFGLVELIDNNPLVCAARVCVPDALSTLALIALGPLIRADLVLERPVIVTDCAGDPEELERALAACGMRGGATTQILPGQERSASATALVAIPTPREEGDLDALFDEAYGRSFFVRRVDLAVWDPSLVRGKPHAAYRLRITPGETESLLSIHVTADLRGKCGAAQIIHVLNVMAGFEETLGLED